MDIWGQIYLDHWRGERHPHVFERDDGHRDAVPDASAYFVAPRGVADRIALEALTGRVLDLGCGPGRYARYLEERGLEVVAVDLSPGAISVCRERGCRDARVLDVDAIGRDLGAFDAVICMGNTFGIGAGPTTLPRRLERVRSVLVPNGRLVLALIDPLATTDPAHLRYHERNRAAGRPPGLTRARIEYRGHVGDWWELWMPTPQELAAAASAAGFDMIEAVPEGNSVLYRLAPHMPSGSDPLVSST
jgi:SAM-dependent methyltransferase